jgi:hypothetical protein
LEANPAMRYIFSLLKKQEKGCRCYQGYENEIVLQKQGTIKTDCFKSTSTEFVLKQKKRSNWSAF